MGICTHCSGSGQTYDEKCWWCDGTGQSSVAGNYMQDSVVIGRSASAEGIITLGSGATADTGNATISSVTTAHEQALRIMRETETELQRDRAEESQRLLACPTCESAAREFADLRARLEAMIAEYEQLDMAAGYSEAARLFAEMRGKLRALLRKEAK